MDATQERSEENTEEGRNVGRIEEINGVVIDIVGPINDVVQCQQVGRVAAPRRSARGGRCENSQVSGARLSRNLAAKAVHCLINKERGKRGLRSLNRRDPLKRAAKRHSRLMVARGCFSHDCPGEPDLVGRVIATDYLPCTCRWQVAENIAWGARRRSTPKAIVDRLDKELAAVLTSPEIQKRFQSEGAEVDHVSQAEFGKLIAAETAKWGRIIKSANIKAE